MPYDCLGSTPIFEMLKRGKKVYAVKENTTALNITPDKISDDIEVFESYEVLYNFLNNENI